MPNESTAAPAIYTTEVSAHVSGVRAPIHFTDGSEATATAAWGVTVQVRLFCLSPEQDGPYRH